MKNSFYQIMSLTHTWVSLIVGWAIFFILVTGTISFFMYDITRWLQPERPLEVNLVEKPQDEQLNAMFDFLSKESPEAKTWMIKLPHIKNQPDNGASRTEIIVRSSLDYGKKYYFNPNTLEEINPIQVRQTQGGVLFRDLHHKFHYIDKYLGIILTGILAFLALVTVVSGVIIHKRIFKDFFTFRSNRNKRSWLDIHNISGVLTLPFVVMILYTGLVYYSPYYVTIPYKMIADKKEERKEAKKALEDSSSLPIMERPKANIKNMLVEAEKKYGVGNIAYISVSRNNSQGLVIDMMPPFGSEITRYTPEPLRFSGISGEKLEATNKPSTGRLTFLTLISLHEAWVVSYPLRWLLFICGVMSCIMVVTGLNLWVLKRKEKNISFGFKVVEKLNIGVFVGLLVGVAGFFIANRVLPTIMFERASWEVHILFLVWLWFILYAFVQPVKKAWVESFYIASFSFALIPIINFLTTNRHLGVTLKEGDFVLAFVDITMLLFALCFALFGYRLQKKWQRVENVKDEELKEQL
ncbi:PepSY-associated TM helix domain-containing protein [Aliarcobacter butzleri]|uniref:PepSY-associated TM helix domain-containing protein n=2 Tax=Aliarcobacter butzleri TaxID=28197 RepID=UPI00263C43A2|nr:PepSY-associated TM helix domain-containing protein [Aliarcobacter butzleri]MDN5092062.1 PepSY-associated TM helix domain-containing protein [Aliarcobacter butzleri]